MSKRRTFKARVSPETQLTAEALAHKARDVSRDLLDVQGAIEALDRDITALEDSAPVMRSLFVRMSGGISVSGTLATSARPSFSGSNLAIQWSPLLSAYGVLTTSQEPGVQEAYFVETLTASQLVLTCRDALGVPVNLSTGTHQVLIGVTYDG